MVNRVLLIFLTSLATCELGSVAIAKESEVSVAGWQPSSGIVVSQLDDSNPDGSDSQQPSAAIQSLQNRLAELGYYDGAVSGIFNSETRDALAQFQEDKGLVGTGILDPLTQQRLADPDGTQAAPAAEAPDAPSDGSAEATPSLDLPPVSESGEVEAADSATPEGTDTTTEGNTAENEGGDETAPSDQASDSPTEVEASEGRNFLVLILVGALVLVLGGVAGGIAIWLSKRQKQDQAATQPQSWSSNPDARNQSGQQPQYSTATPPPPPRASQQMPGHNRNGNPVGNQQSALDIQHRSMPIDNLAEPRVAKVNIVDELIHDLQQPDPDLRRKAIWELGQRGNSAAMQPLVNLLTEVDSHEQSLILAALAEITSQTLKPMNRAVMIALQSENAEVRKNAIRDLTRIFDSLSQSGRMLGHVAIDDDPDVRQTADWALDQLNKMRSSASDTAARLRASEATQERLSSEANQERLPEDGNSAK